MRKIRAVKTIVPYKENNNIKKLIGHEGYRLRVGNYRIIYRIDTGKLEILVINIDVRGEVYK
ncbi:type II toxin-antitoxin system RelE family toxin [Rickettsia helvetica]|uniref:type II toxin-antitoxin system RelE family toxin n=1 Tax=Rickettsia helvetica TaxID=35789 RepID=UPI00397AAF10